MGSTANSIALQSHSDLNAATGSVQHTVGSGALNEGGTNAADILGGSKVGGNQTTTYNGLTGVDVTSLIGSITGKPANNSNTTGSSSPLTGSISAPSVQTTGSGNVPIGPSAISDWFTKHWKWLLLIVPGGALLWLIVKRAK